MSLWLGTLGASGLISGGDFESIATVTVGSGGASEIEFTSIPSTYQHLQIRGIGRTQRPIAATAGKLLRLNSDTANNYARHILYGDSSSAASAAQSSFPYISWIATFPDNNNPVGEVGPFVIDILDYASTSKNKTIRSFHGSGPYLGITSGLWQSTSAITTVSLLDATGSGHAQYTTAALYGIKAP